MFPPKGKRRITWGIITQKPRKSEALVPGRTCPEKIRNIHCAHIIAHGTHKNARSAFVSRCPCVYPCVCGYFQNGNSHSRYSASVSASVLGEVSPSCAVFIAAHSCSRVSTFVSSKVMRDNRALNASSETVKVGVDA